MSAIDFKEQLETMGRQAKAAARRLSCMSAIQKNRCLEAMADAISEQEPLILAANTKDLANGTLKGLSPALLERLTLTPERIREMTKALRALTGLPDPIGHVDSTWLRPNGLEIRKVRVPIGVICIIYESRPNVTVDAAGLCLKSGNAVFLRGGSEAFESNQALARALTVGGESAGLPQGAIQLLPWADRQAVDTLLKMDRYIDLIIPRGGEGLIRKVVETSTIPVIKHFKGVCHVYVDKAADPEMALNIIENAKCQRPGVCNALETVLVHCTIADTFLPSMAERLQTQQVELRGDNTTCSLIPGAIPATEEDWTAEYLDLILAIRVVDSFEQAVDHIATYGSGHSDAIITADKDVANAFLTAVDSAAVYVNASTRFTDGSQFGMGAEIGISTDRIHARGPMGIDELTTYKYLVLGDGQVRE